MEMTNNKCQMSNKISIPNNQSDNKNRFDLEERTSLFSEGVIDFCKKLPVNLVTTPIISQLIRSATSIGANYCEADNAESRKDFKHKITICNKEAKETKYWLRMLIKAMPYLKAEITCLRKEATEFNLIFSKIILTTKKNMNN